MENEVGYVSYLRQRISSHLCPHGKTARLSTPSTETSWGLGVEFINVPDFTNVP